MQDYLTLARPYAKAAFEFALAHKAVPEWQKFLHECERIIKDPQTVAFRRNPEVTEAQLLELVKSVFGEQIDQFMDHTLKLLASRKRLALLPAIAHTFHEFKSEYEKVADVDVYSVTPLTADQLQHLSQKLETRLQRKVAMHEHTDASLLGGFLVRAGDFVIDGSLRGRLERLTHALTD